MGVGKTVYKGEVETGVFAWFWSRSGHMPVSQSLRNPCGSEPARDEGGSVNIYVVCPTVIASRLAPTGF
jgi:hypothetical protein